MSTWLKDDLILFKSLMFIADVVYGQNVFVTTHNKWHVYLQFHSIQTQFLCLKYGAEPADIFPVQ